MKQLLLKELKESISNWIGWVSIASFFTITTAFLWIFPDTSYFSYGYATPELFFELAYYILIFIIPILTIGGLSSEFKSGTIEILKSLPISWRDIIFAKFLGGCGFLLIIIGFSFATISVLSDISRSATFDYQQVLGSYLGLLLIGSILVALSIAVSSFFENSSISFIVSILIGFLIYSGLSFLAAVEMFPQGLQDYIASWGLLHHSDYLSKGVLPMSSLIYMLSIVLFLLGIAHWNLERENV